VIRYRTKHEHADENERLMPRVPHASLPPRIVQTALD